MDRFFGPPPDLNLRQNNPIDYDDLQGIQHRHPIILELNRQAKEELDGSGSEWLLFDLRHIGYDAIEVDYGVEKHYYSKDWIIKNRTVFERYAKKNELSDIRVGIE